MRTGIPALKLALLAVMAFAPSLMASAAPQPQQVDVHAIAQATDDHYNHIKSFKAQFTQDYEGAGGSRKESGTLWLRKPGRMRWEYTQPRKKLFVCDSQTVYFYVPGERQARKSSVKQLDDIRSPLRYLLGKTRLEKEMDGLSLAPDITPSTAGNRVLRGVPKGMKDRISEVILEISPEHNIVRIVIREADGATTDFHFSGVQENLPMPDSLFHFVPGPGVEIIDERQISQ